MFLLVSCSFYAYASIYDIVLNYVCLIFWKYIF